MLQTSVRRGELDREITLIKKIIAATSISNEDKKEGWEQIVTDANVFARVKMKPGREVAVMDRLAHVQNTLFTIDYREDITTENRVVYKERVYEIISIIELERDRFIDVVTTLIDNETYTGSGFSEGFSSGFE